MQHLRYLAILYLFIGFYLEAEPLKYKIRGKAAILMNAQTGSILFEHQSSFVLYPASTTKIATALYALKLNGHDLQRMMTADQDSLVSLTQEAKRKSKYTSPAHWLEPDGVHIGIKKGEVLSFRALLEGLLISSGNDAANVIAEALGPTVPVFMSGLNAYLKEIGCENTFFRNPHGLHDPEHQSTAYDLAVMTREALKHPLFCEIVSKTRFYRPKTNKQAAATFLQTNRLLRPGKFYYSKAIGVKTGYHSKAKNNLVSAARLEGRTLILVLLGYDDRSAVFDDAVKLFETAFNQPKVQRVFFKSGAQSFKQELAKGNGLIETYLVKPLTLEFYPAEEPQVKCLLYWHSLSLPILKDQEVGELRLVSSTGEILNRTTLLAKEDVSMTWPYRWLDALSLNIWIFIFILGVIGIAFAFWRRRML